MKVLEIILSIFGLGLIGGLIYIGRKLQILDDLKLSTHKIKSNLKVVSDFLIKSNNNFDPTELQAYSPLRLTEVGDKFIQDIGFNNVFDKHKKDFFDCISNENPKFKYDVEAAAIRSIYFLYEKEYMSFLKQYFYNNPRRNIQNTASTLGIYIRDQYLKAHPEIL